MNVLRRPAFLALVLLSAAASAHARPYAVGTTPVTELDSTARLDLNRATREELERLPRVGPTRAKAILADRASRGPFVSVDDLERVKGIGPATLRALRPLVTVTPPPHPRKEQSEPIARPPRRTINVNLATAVELRTLPGVDDAAVLRLLEARPLPDHGAVCKVLASKESCALVRGRLRFRLDVNRATASELVAIGAPAAAAQTVVELRDQLGPFETIDELGGVPELDAAALAKLAPMLYAGKPGATPRGGPRKLAGELRAKP